MGDTQLSRISQEQLSKKINTGYNDNDNDQYWVKIDGSGRLTLRNRRFLRKYTQHATTINILAPAKRYNS